MVPRHVVATRNEALIGITLSRAVPLFFTCHMSRPWAEVSNPWTDSWRRRWQLYNATVPRDVI